MILFSSCGSQLIKQGPKRAKNETFYKLSDKKGVIFHNRCKKVKKKNRECVLTEYDLLNDWEFFRGSFILIPVKYVFP